MITTFDYKFSQSSLDGTNKLIKSSAQLGIEGEPSLQIYDSSGNYYDTNPGWISGGSDSGEVTINWNDGVLTIDFSPIAPLSGEWTLKFDRSCKNDSGLIPKEIEVDTVASDGDLLICLTGGITISLPADPTDGARIKVTTQEIDGDVSIVPAANSNIIGENEFIIGFSWSSCEFAYNSEHKVWRVITPQISKTSKNLGYAPREIAASVTATANDLLICNVGGVVIRLPQMSANGTAIKVAVQEIADPVTVMAEGSDHIGSETGTDQTMIIEDSFSSVEFIYSEFTSTWKVVTPHVPKVGQSATAGGGYIPVEISSSASAKPNDFVICRKSNLAVNLPGEPAQGTMIKVAAQSLGPVSVIPAKGDKVAGLGSLVVRRNSMVELIYNLNDKEWRVISSTGEINDASLSPDNDVADEGTLVHRTNIKTRDEFKDWICRKLGYPLVSVELTDEQLDDAINDSLVEFYEYAYQIRKFFAVDLKDYVSGVGAELPIGVVGVTKLTSNLIGPNAVGAGRIDSYMNDLVANGAIGFPMLGRPAGSGWVNYELAMSYLEFSQKMLGGDYDPFYDVRTRMLTLIPDPIKSRQDQGWVVCECQCVREEEKQYGEVWVKKMALALSKITLGEIRSKFSNINFPGGGSLSTGMKESGEAERNELRVELRERYPLISIFKY